MDLAAPACPYCLKRTTRGAKESRYRRGRREVAVPSHYWECASNCAGPDGERPFRFQDPPLMRLNDEAARAAWMEKFEEPMPPAGRPGRKTRAPRSAPIQVRLTEREREQLERSRGDLSLSAYVRSAVFHRPASPRAPGFPLTETDVLDGPHRRAS